jgi:hypothetical protein
MERTVRLFTIYHSLFTKHFLLASPFKVKLDIREEDEFWRIRELMR